MTQVILLENYQGLSDFILEVECTGSRLSIDQALEKSLVTEEQLKRHEKSSYSKEWWQVDPGDQIILTIDDGSDRIEHIFIVPEEGMLRPNTNLDEGIGIHQYLRKHLIEQCTLVNTNLNSY